jgi:cob(I)alamin adenosyltransferase
MNSIVTKTGDKGTTGLFGGARVPKHSPRIEACGTVDELNAVLGIVLCQPYITRELREKLTAVQHVLFEVAADLATPHDFAGTHTRVKEEDILCLENEIHRIELLLPTQKAFILPGGTPLTSFLHLARTVCRRAERDVVKLASVEETNEFVLKFLNRLSDYLFILARYNSDEKGGGDVSVKY